MASREGSTGSIRRLDCLGGWCQTGIWGLEEKGASRSSICQCNTERTERLLGTMRQTLITLSGRWPSCDQSSQSSSNHVRCPKPDAAATPPDTPQYPWDLQRIPRIPGIPKSSMELNAGDTPQQRSPEPRALIDKIGVSPTGHGSRRAPPTTCPYRHGTIQNTTRRANNVKIHLVWSNNHKDKSKLAVDRLQRSEFNGDLPDQQSSSEPLLTFAPADKEQMAHMLRDSVRWMAT